MLHLEYEKIIKEKNTSNNFKTEIVIVFLCPLYFFNIVCIFFNIWLYIFAGRINMERDIDPFLIYKCMPY